MILLEAREESKGYKQTSGDLLKNPMKRQTQTRNHKLRGDQGEVGPEVKLCVFYIWKVKLHFLFHNS